MLAVLGGVALFFGLELLEEPGLSPLAMVLELVDIIPVVLMSVGVVLLFRISYRQREEQLLEPEERASRCSRGRQPPRRGCRLGRNLPVSFM